MASSIDASSGTSSNSQSPVEGEQPLLRTLPPTSEDLLILARDDEFYWLQGAAYMDDQHRIETSMIGQARELVHQGVVLADIPVGSIPGVGCMCYLVNLGGLRRPPVRSTPAPPTGRAAFKPPPLDPADPGLQEPAPGIDDLVIRGRNWTLYWVRKAEYQRDACRLDVAEPILEEQLRLLTNQGVVLADVPGGSLPGVDDMGCLVNLNAIHRPEAKEEFARMRATHQEGKHS